MLNCTVCGHDNFPFTSAQINGWASGQSLQMVQKCHNCGAKVSEVCCVCHQLHPLNTIYCSVYGLHTGEFADLKNEIPRRVEQFKELPEVKAAIARLRRRFMFFGKGLLLGFIFLFISSFFQSSILPILSLIFIGLCGLFFASLLLSNDDEHLMNLWRQLNPDVLEPCNIFVFIKSIDIDFQSETGIYSGRSFRTDLINFALTKSH